jgi:hypothetical protein
MFGTSTFNVSVQQNANHKKQEFGVYVHHSLILLRVLLILTGSWHITCAVCSYN